MNIPYRAALAGAASALLLAGCAAVPGGPAPTNGTIGSASPAPPPGHVVGQGMVMETGGSLKLCLGAIMESYPPQCSGIPLRDWSWDGVDGSESEGDIRWGMYAVTGTYDGAEFTVTQEPIMLALYDPPMHEDPTGGEPGETSDAELEAIQVELHSRTDDLVLSSWPSEGYLWVDVVWDDGSFQSGADGEFGADVVIVRSALRELDG